MLSKHRRIGCAGLGMVVGLGCGLGDARGAVASASVPFVLLDFINDPTLVQVEIPRFPTGWGDLTAVGLSIEGGLSVTGTSPHLDPFTFEVEVIHILFDDFNLEAIYEASFRFSGKATEFGEPFAFSAPSFEITANFDAATDAAGGVDDHPFVFGPPEFDPPTRVSGTRSDYVTAPGSSPSKVLGWFQLVEVTASDPSLESALFAEISVTTTAILTVAYDFDANFGTRALTGKEVGVGTIGTPTPLNGIPVSHSLSTEGGDMAARARVSPGLFDPQKKSPQDTFGLGLFAKDTRADPFSPQAYSSAAARYSVQGQAATGVIQGAFTVEGTFNVEGGAVGPDGTVNLQFFVHAGDANEGLTNNTFLSSLVVISGGTGVSYTRDTINPVTRQCDSCISGTGWPGLQIVPFLLPTAEDFMNVECWILADAFADKEVTVDFLQSATLEIFPPPAVRVTLSTGQVFAGPGDCDGDLDIDLHDFLPFAECVSGPGAEQQVTANCRCAEFDRDGNVDLADLAALQAAFTGPR